MRSRIALLVLVCVGSAIGACVIGPKQDDPASGSPEYPAADTGTAGGEMDGSVGVDDEAGAVPDTGDKTPSADALSSDAPVDGAGDAPSDAPSDASGDGAADAPADGDAASD
jgi:hypothetical protein